MAAKPIGAEIPEEPDYRTMPPIRPPWIGPMRMEKLFDEHEFEPAPLPMPRQHMLADAGDDSPVLMEIARLLAEDSIPRPTRIDLSGMPGPRGRGEVSRIDLPALIEAMEPQTVNRDAKRDSLATVETPSLARGIAQEGLGQALLLGYGDDIEGWLKGRHPEDIRRERLAFGDANPATALGANVAGIAAGGLGGRAVKGLMSGARAAREMDEDLAPRFEPDVRQAMRNASDAEAAAKPTDDMIDQLQRLLSNPEARADIQGKPLELSPADIFTLTTDAQTSAPAEPQPDELDMSGMSPIDRLRMGLELSQAGAQNLTEEEKARNADINRQALMEMTPIIGNWMAAKDAGTSAGEASAAFSRGDTRAGLMQSALAALSGIGAVTGLPTSKTAGAVAKGAKDSANVFLPAWDIPKSEAAKTMRDAGTDNRAIWEQLGVFYGPEGKLRQEVLDNAMQVDLGGAKVGGNAVLGDIAEHPELFSVRPDLAQRPVLFTDQHNSFGASSSRTNPTTGDFEISLIPSDKRGDIAKLLQYEISKDARFPEAMRHGSDKAATALEMARIRAERAGGDDEALSAYIASMQRARDMLGDTRGAGSPQRGRTVGAHSAGNIESKVVSGRATLDDPERFYPWGRKAPYHSRSPAQRPPGFENMIVLPPQGASLDELALFLEQWRQYGAGKGP